MGVSEDKNLRGEGGNAPIPPGGAVRVLGEHWDPSNPRDVAMINRHARERPRAFAEAGPEAEAVAREMMKLSAQCAREGKERAQTTEDLIDVGKLAAQSGTLATNIRKVLQADDHHADDVARGAGEGASVNIGIAVGRPLTDADRIRIAVENNVVHLLPPELAEQARKALP